MLGYNVGHVLEKTYNELPKNFADEIILVDDGSIDNTMDVARNLGLNLIMHHLNRGYGAAQKTGFKEALSKKADAVILVHGDNQYDPSLVPEFARKILEEGYDLVTGTRMVLGDAIKGGMPLWKYIPNRLLTHLENFVFQTNISDYHNGFRAYSGKFLSEIPLDFLSDKFDFDTDIIIQGAIRNYKIAEIPHGTLFRDENSKMSFTKGIVYGLSILKTVFVFILHKSKLCRQKVFEEAYG